MKLNTAIWMTAVLPAMLMGAVIEGEKVGDVRVVPVERTPEPDAVDIKIAYPRENEVEDDNPVRLKLRVETFALGVYSDFPRAKEIRDSKEGQAIHIIVDDRPYISINEAIDEMSESEEIDYDQTLTFLLPYTLPEGEHVIRAFPVRSYDESLKGPNAFQADVFYIGDKKSKSTYNLDQAYLTYNQPQGEFDRKKPILLDFFVTNTQLSKDGYKVRLTIDGTDKRILTEWNPYYIYGLKKGSHTIKLELLDPSNNVVPPLFNDLERKITVR